MPEGKEARHNVDVVAVSAMTSECGSAHGYNAVCDVREVEVETVLLVPTPVL